MKSIPVDIKHLEEVYNIDLHEFEPGRTYPMLKLMDALGLAHGSLRYLPRGNTK